MEKKSPLITKRIWKLVHVMFFMVKKRIAKTNILADLNMMISKRGKIAGKALQNLNNMFHHNNHNNANIAPSGDYEFSCRNTPPYPLSLFSNHKKYHSKRDHDLSTTSPPLALDEDDCNDNMVINAAVLNVLNHMRTNGATSTPPRITDSPFPETNGREDNGRVDEAAQMFINRFYNDRRRES
uniref:uncharacterized protein LOC122607083 n=1 Tax=Erigeron canadensis TaxID=72917 RepID=UPI001CB89FAD|nr:uncharacterized protein LOC122607083 [Erigeron canadensis]